MDTTSNRPRRSHHDLIGSKRMEKLEEMNNTHHDLLMELLKVLEMPNVGKLRLISQREIEGASKAILDHAAKVAAAFSSLKALQDEVRLNICCFLEIQKVPIRGLPYRNPIIVPIPGAYFGLFICGKWQHTMFTFWNPTFNLGEINNQNEIKLRTLVSNERE